MILGFLLGAFAAFITIGIADLIFNNQEYLNGK